MANDTQPTDRSHGLMKMKYNIAFFPQQINNNLITLAQNFSNISDSYLLGKRSHPHVTIYAFNNSEITLQELITSIDNALNNKKLALTLNEFSYITFDENIFWLSLLPDNRKTLQSMHEQIANILHLPIKDTFDPHLTLTNTRIKNLDNQFNKVLQEFKPISDTFTLGIGISDDIGQVIEIIYKF